MVVLLGFRWVDPFTIAGALGVPAILGNVISVVGFVLAALLISRYQKKFYEGRPVPAGWTLFYAGLILIALHQLFEVPIMYGWAYGVIPVLFFVFFDVATILSIVIGTYLISKEA
jgi:hypothetical protein